MVLKKISLSLISCLYLLNYVTPFNQFVNKSDKYMCVETFDDIYYELNGEQYKLVASLPDKNIKLFAIKSCNYPGYYDKFLLSENSMSKIFEWKSSYAIQWSPRLILRDINNDKIEELIIILTLGTGTALHEEEIHIINMNYLDKKMYFEEYMISDPLIIIKEKVGTRIIEKDEGWLIQVKLNDNEYIIKTPKFIYDVEDVGFGNITIWEISENKLYCHIPAQVSTGVSIGTVIIEYKYNRENQFFNLGNIIFKERSDYKLIK